MKDFLIPRTGLAPLKFEGELLEETSSKWVTGREQNRWHEVEVYHTKSGKYVLHIGYRTQWQGELDHDAAEVLAGPSDVVAAFERYDPTKHVGGYPPGDTYAERQGRLLHQITQNYKHLVSEVLNKHPEFAEEV